MPLHCNQSWWCSPSHGSNRSLAALVPKHILSEPGSTCIPPVSSWYFTQVLIFHQSRAPFGLHLQHNTHWLNSSLLSVLNLFHLLGLILCLSLLASYDLPKKPNTPYKERSQEIGLKVQQGTWWPLSSNCIQSLSLNLSKLYSLGSPLTMGHAFLQYKY